MDTALSLIVLKTSSCFSDFFWLLDSSEEWQKAPYHVMGQASCKDLAKLSNTLGQLRQGNWVIVTFDKECDGINNPLTNR
jgi:hypothetical protein